MPIKRMRHAKKPGQGIIEYAGAMIVASLVVAGIVVIGPSSMGNVFTTITSFVQSFITDELTS